MNKDNEDEKIKYKLSIGLNLKTDVTIAVNIIAMEKKMCENSIFFYPFGVGRHFMSC